MHHDRPACQLEPAKGTSERSAGVAQNSGLVGWLVGAWESNSVGVARAISFFEQYLDIKVLATVAKRVGSKVGERV